MMRAKGFGWNPRRRWADRDHGADWETRAVPYAAVQLAIAVVFLRLVLQGASRSQADVIPPSIV